MSDPELKRGRRQVLIEELEKKFIVRSPAEDQLLLPTKVHEKEVITAVGPTKSKSFTAVPLPRPTENIRGTTTPPTVPPRPPQQTVTQLIAELNRVQNASGAEQHHGDVENPVKTSLKPPVPKKPSKLLRSAILNTTDISSSTESFVTAATEWPDSSSNSAVSNSEKSPENSFDEEEKTPIVDQRPLPSAEINTSVETAEMTSNRSGVFDTMKVFNWKRKNAKRSMERSKTLGNIGDVETSGRPKSVELIGTDDSICHSPGNSVFYMAKENISQEDPNPSELHRSLLRQTCPAGHQVASMAKGKSVDVGMFKFPPPGQKFYTVARRRKKLSSSRTAGSLDVPQIRIERPESTGTVLRSKTQRSSRGKTSGRRPSQPLLSRSLSDSLLGSRSSFMSSENSTVSSQLLRTSSYKSSLYRDSSSLNSDLYDSSSDESEVEEAKLADNRVSRYYALKKDSELKTGAVEETAVERKRKKLYFAAEEFLSTEGTYIDNLKMLAVDFPKHIDRCSRVLGRPVAEEQIVDQIVRSLEPLLQLHQNLLADFELCIRHWNNTNIDLMDQSISDVLVKKGAFIKMASIYVKQKNFLVDQIQSSARKYPDFEDAIVEFEKDRCKRLKFTSYFDCVHQRVCRYPLLISHYKTYLEKESNEFKKADAALHLMTQVAITVEQSLSDGDNTKRLLEIQRKVLGQYEIIAPGRQLLKEGELLKFSRKEQQPRLLFLFSDQLIIGIPVAAGQFRIRTVIPLLMIVKVEHPTHSELKKQFLIYSQQRSFTMIARSAHESGDWVKSILAAVAHVKNLNKMQMTVEKLRDGEITDLKPPDSPATPTEVESQLGKVAPCWVPDSNVTMCQHCSVQFRLFLRRHHCRACGKIICGDCCGKAPLAYSNFESQRVCPTCYATILCQLDQMPSHGGIMESKKHADPYGGSPPSRQALISRFKPPAISYHVKDSPAPHPGSSLNSSFDASHQDTADPEELMSGSLDVKFPDRQGWRRCWVKLMPPSLLEIYLAKDDTKVERKIVLLSCDVVETHPDDPNFVGTEFQIVHTNQISVSKSGSSASFVYVFRADSVATGVSWLSQIKDASQFL